MGIGTKLGLGTGTLLCVGLVIGAVSYLQTSSVHAKLDELTSVREPVNSAAQGLKKRVFEVTSATLGYFMTGDTTLRSALRQSRNDFQNGRQNFLVLLDGATDRVTASSILDGFTRYYILAADQIDLRDEQARQMQELQVDLDAIDALLKNRIQASVRADDPIAYRRLQVALEMQIQMNALMKGLGNFLLTGEERFQGRIAEARKAFSHFLQVYQVVLLSSEEKGWAEDLITRSNRSLAKAATITALQVRRSSGMKEFMGQYVALGSRIDDPLLQRTSIDLASAKRDLVEAGQRANSTIMAVLLVGMMFGIGAAVITTRKITSPLRQLITVMNAVDQDGPGREIELQSSDEFRQVGESFNTMMRRLIRANENLKNEIAERRRVEENLTESELRFRTIFEDAPIGVALADAHGIILQANSRLLEILRRKAPEDLCGKTLESAIGSTAVSQGSQPGGPLRYRLEMTGLGADGTRSWISVNVSSVMSGAGEAQYNIIMMEDLTAQHELQQKVAEAEQERLQGMRLFAQSVQRAQEEERSRIARELHDDICQRITGMKYRVEVLEAGTSKTNQRVAKQLGAIRQELDRSLTEVRRISSNLRPSVLDDFGLVTALRILSREFRESHTILPTIRVDPAISGRIDAESETAIFRITQQALANIAHHSKATSVTISLDLREGKVVLCIVDDGRGFTNTGWGTGGASGNGFGLVSMRERAELLGGNFFIESDLDHGTKVTVTIPLREA